MRSVPAMMASRSLLLLPILFGLVATAPAQQLASTTPIDLDQIVTRAQTIVRGHVISIRTEPHPQFPSLKTVVVALQTDRVLKGAAERTFAFRQYVFGGSDSVKASGYGKAEEVLLFLNPVSQYGLTSPVGLEQGRFRIERDAQGSAFAINGRGNEGLFSQVEAKARSRGTTLSPRVQAMMRTPAEGKVPLDDFEEAVVALTEGQR